MSYTVSPSDLSLDREAVLGLWRENLPEASANRYAWLYESETTAGWLVKSAENEVVGSSGLMRRGMRAFGRTIRAGQTIDLNVRQDHRSVGPALGLQRAVAATVAGRQFDLLYTFPNEKSEPVQRRIGYREVGLLDRWVKPLRLGARLKSRLGSVWLRAMAPLLANPYFYLKSPETYYRRPAGLHTEITDRFDERFDRLWQTAAAQFPIVGERTSAYLTWRFGQCPGAGYRALCLMQADGRLLAYAVFRHEDDTAYLGDFFFDTPDHLHSLMAEVLRQLRRERAETVVTLFLGTALVRQKLAQFGFYRRPSGRKLLVYTDPQQFDANADRLLDRENWYLTTADVDTDS